MVNSLTYRQLRPEVKMTFDKIMYQLEMIARTMQLLEQRIVDSEDKLQEVMTYIKNNDITFEPKVVN